MIASPLFLHFKFVLLYLVIKQFWATNNPWPPNISAPLGGCNTHSGRGSWEFTWREVFYWKKPLQSPPSICLATSRETTYAFESSNDVNVFSLTPVKYAFQVLPLFPTDGTVGLIQGNNSEFMSQKCNNNNNNNNTSAELYCFHWLLTHRAEVQTMSCRKQKVQSTFGDSIS